MTAPMGRPRALALGIFMARLVMKFGGTSVGSADRMRTVRGNVCDHRHRVLLGFDGRVSRVFAGPACIAHNRGPLAPGLSLRSSAVLGGRACRAVQSAPLDGNLHGIVDFLGSDHAGMLKRPLRRP